MRKIRAVVSRLRQPHKEAEAATSRLLGLVEQGLMHAADPALRERLSLSRLDKSRLRSGGPVFLQIGGRVVYDLPDLDAYLASCRRQ